MKKVLVIFLILIIILGIFSFSSKVLATEKAIDEKTESKLVEIKETQTKSIEDYKEKYGSDTYGLVAYILNIIRIYSIPFCFLGIVISAIYQYVIGIRKLDVRYKGFYTMIAFITLFVIAQVLPLVFVIVIKGFGRS